MPFFWLVVIEGMSRPLFCVLLKSRIALALGLLFPILTFCAVSKFEMNKKNKNDVIIFFFDLGFINIYNTKLMMV